MDTPEINDGGPAFPFPTQFTFPDTHGGMTLRDYFAKGILPAVLFEFFEGVERGNLALTEDWRMGVAMDAYSLADAMIAAREAKS